MSELRERQDKRVELKDVSEMRRKDDAFGRKDVLDLKTMQREKNKKGKRVKVKSMKVEVLMEKHRH